MKIRTIIISILFLVGGIALASAEANINLNIKFDQIYGLKSGDRVIFELNYIGNVGDVNYGMDGIYNVNVTIRNNFANAVTEYSKFFIIDDPVKKDNKAIEIILEQTGGTPLKDGSIVVGSVNSLGVLEKLEIDIEKGLENLKREYRDFQGKVDKFPESDEYQDLKKKLADIVEQLKIATKVTNEKIQKELIPKLIRELDKLERMLKKYGEEEQDKPSKKSPHESMPGEPTKI